MSVRCVWWDRTGEMTPFDKYGISSPIYRNTETQERLPSHELPVGSLYWMTSEECNGAPGGPDGKRVYCVVLDRKRKDGNWGVHHWCIDGRANNCTMPEDNAHRCWVRHGTIGEKIHVDKNGLTCQAGGGSIQTTEWHGHLHNGELIP